MRVVSICLNHTPSYYTHAPRVRILCCMEFGKLQDISKVDFALPPDGVLMLEPQPSVNAPQVFTGCPVWACKEWIGKLYPHGAREKDFLRHYSRQFNTIELNTTHYRIPDDATISRWHQETPQGFKFSPKIPQEISHRLLPQGNARALSDYFCEQLRGLQDRLGTCFLQLPPQFAPAQWALLEKFLEEFPPDIELAIEFRHTDWFRTQAPDKPKPVEEVAHWLHRKGFSMVICDVSGRRDVLHQSLSNSTALIRFVGNNLHVTDYSRIDAWVERLALWLANGLQSLYFFAHEPDNILAPELASYFITALNRKMNWQIKVPRLAQAPPQMSLF